MNSGGWYIFLFLFILGITCQSINQLGFWNFNEPNPGYVGVTADQFNSTQQSAAGTAPGIFTVWQWVITFMTIIGSGLVAVFSIGGLFYGMGWPVGLVGAAILQLIQLPANIVMFFWLFELWTGH